MRGRRRKPSQILLDHLARDLGHYGGEGVARPEWELDFSVFQFPDRPVAGVTASVTFGISAHVVEGADGVERAQELAMFLRDGDAAIQICANVGAYVVDRHVALLEGETINMPLFEDALDMLVVIPPEPYATLARCTELNPPVEVVRLLPFARDEHHVVTEHGWRDLLRWLDERGLDVYDLRREALV